MTNEPTAEVPATRGPGSGAGLARPGGAVATGAAPGTAEPGEDLGTPATAPAPVPHAGGSATVAASDPASGGPASGPGEAPASASDVPGPAREAGHPAAAPPGRRRRRWPVVVLTLALVAALAAAGYLLATTLAYADQLAWTEAQARAIGTDLTVTRGELEGARAEIAGLQAQLTTAQERITALADEKAQIGDDREAQRQLLDYQARVSEAAGTVASALDRCVQGQDQLIAYLEDAESYDPAELTRFGADVEALCRSASEANEALQSELADR